MTLTPQQILDEQLERLHLIASGDRDCDMSENDLAALRAVLLTFDEQAAALRGAAVPSQPDCENGDCRDHYGDEAAWCNRCKGAAVSPAPRYGLSKSMDKRLRAQGVPEPSAVPSEDKLTTFVAAHDPEVWEPERVPPSGSDGTVEQLVEQLWSEIPFHRRAQLIASGFSIDPILLAVRASAPASPQWQDKGWAPKQTRLLVALISDGQIWRVSDAIRNDLGFYTISGESCHWATHFLPLPPVQDGEPT